MGRWSARPEQSVKIGVVVNHSDDQDVLVLDKVGNVVTAMMVNPDWRVEFASFAGHSGKGGDQVKYLLNIAGI